MSFSLLGTGSPLLDIQLWTTDEFLSKHVPGSKGGMEPISVEDIDRIIAASSAAPSIFPGGAAGNTVFALSSFQVKCALRGKLGDDKYKEKYFELPPEIEHIYPDYSIYPEFTKDTAYGFMSRGCQNGCEFCHVGAKEGRKSYKVADLSEFWKGQKNIVLLDPNPTDCLEWRDNLQQLIDSGSTVDFCQGVNIRTMTLEKAEMIKKIKVKSIHFAWDRYEDKNLVVPKLEMFKKMTGWGRSKISVYILVNFNTTKEQDMERAQFCRSIGVQPYPMIYNKGEFFYRNGRLRPLDELLKKYSQEQIDHAIFCRDFQVI